MDRVGLRLVADSWPVLLALLELRGRVGGVRLHEIMAFEGVDISRSMVSVYLRDLFRRGFVGRDLMVDGGGVRGGRPFYLYWLMPEFVEPIGVLRDLELPLKPSVVIRG